MRDYKPPSFFFFPQIPSGTVGRVVDDKCGSVITASTSNLDDIPTYLSSSDLFYVVSVATLFKVRSTLISTRLPIRKLNIQELLRLWYYPDHVISSLASRRRNLIWENNSVPLQVLGMLLRFLLLLVTS